jgi:CDP-diacylglycerol---glycerol-3-phosphate 3-phosphatidyltransferase
MAINPAHTPAVPSALKRAFVIFAILCAGLLVVCYAWLIGQWGGLAAGVYGLCVLLPLIYLFIHLWLNLSANHAPGQVGAINPTLGAANWMTLSRGVMLAFLTGFLTAPLELHEGSGLAWAPGLLYLIAASLDYLDGGVARLLKHPTRLGEILDMDWDSYGVMLACTLLVRYGQVPIWYLLVGLARYIYLAGSWYRAKRGLPVYPLPPSAFRRALAGTQMGFIAALLLPVFRPPVTWVAALLFMLPFLLGFLRDWLAVSGATRLAGQITTGKQMERWVLPLLRLMVGAALGSVLIGSNWNILIIAAAVVILAGILTGAAGRFFSLALLLLSGIALQLYPADWRYWFILLASTALMTFGTGRLSVWKPEEWLIYHRIGESSDLK